MTGLVNYESAHSSESIQRRVRNVERLGSLTNMCAIVRREKVIIPVTKPHITLQGEGRNRTVITWNDTAGTAGTLMSASVVVESDHFIARDISFKVRMTADDLLG